jgi:hypothetical protein
VLAEDQPPCRWLPRGVDLVKVPAQPIDDPGRVRGDYRSRTATSSQR